MVNMSQIEFDTCVECYLAQDYEDPHSEVSKRLNISRAEAKELGYKFFFRSKFFRNFVKNLQEGKND